MLMCSAQNTTRKVEMECNTGAEVLFDVGSLYAHLQELKDSRKPRGLRYQLVTVLVMMVMAKLCGEDTPSGIADWVKHRSEQIVEMLKLKRRSMPHHSTYRRITEEVVNVEELEQLVSTVLASRKFFGKQVLVSIDGKYCEVHWMPCSKEHIYWQRTDRKSVV